MPKLRQSRSKAKELLNNQLRAVDAFLALEKTSTEQVLEDTKSEFSAWEDYTATLLDSLFDTNELALEFSHDDVSVFIGRDTLQEKMRDFAIDVERRKQRLISIVGKLELYEEEVTKSESSDENESDKKPNDLSEPPDYIKHLSWLFRKDTWKHHPTAAVVVSLVFLGGIIGTGYGLAAAFRPNAANSYLAVTKVRPISDQITTVRKFGDSATVSLFWELTLSNNRASPLSIIDFDAKQVPDNGPMDYTGLKQGIYKLEGGILVPLNLPITIDEGNSIAVFVELGVMLDKKAWEILEPHLNESAITSNMIFEILKNEETDVFGNPFLKQDTGVYSLPKLNEIHEPIFGLTFKTSENVSVNEIVSWYRYGLFREVGNGE